MNEMDIQPTEHNHEPDTTRKRRRGQTLAEFAFTLPILLLLTFGVIEFGRMFQAWVTLQNAAAQAARYASTGAYYEGAEIPGDLVAAGFTGYEMKDELAADPNDPNSLVPCMDEDRRGTISTYNGVNIYEGDIEALFATWYNGLDCDPRNIEHQGMRQDLARILSIYHEARLGAAGLNLPPEIYPTIDPPATNAPSDQPWYYVWDRTVGNRLTGSDQSGWFYTTICSSRAKIYQDGPSFYSGVEYDDLRFNLEINNTNYGPTCFLNELPLPNPNDVDDPDERLELYNGGIPWVDPGSPGDSVTVVVQFNHPLITPIGLAPYLPLRAQRTAVVESFRAARAASAFTGSSAPGSVFGQPTATNTFTPTASPLPSDTPTPTDTPTTTPSPTSTPVFDCNLVTIDYSSFFTQGDQMSITFINNNPQATRLIQSTVRWRNIGTMYLRRQAFASETYWQEGNPSDQVVDGATNTITVSVDANNPTSDFISSASRELAGFTTSAGTARFDAIFESVPGNLRDYLTLYDFYGSEWSFRNPTTGALCPPLQLNAIGTPTPSPTFDPSVTPTPTLPIDCASVDISIAFAGFQSSFGVVRFDITNNRPVAAPFRGFRINWNDALPAAPNLVLAEVRTGGSAFGSSTRVWIAGSGEDDDSPTTAGAAPVNSGTPLWTAGDTEGTWVRDYDFAGNATQPLWLRFEGAGTATSLYDVGMRDYHFNNSVFTFGCDEDGDGDGSGSNDNGGITIQNFPTPVPDQLTGSWTWEDLCSYATNPGTYDVALNASLQNAASWHWDIDGDGTVDPGEPTGTGNPDQTFDFGAAGNHNAVLRATAAAGAVPASIAIPSDGSVNPSYPINVGSLPVPSAGTGGVGVGYSPGTLGPNNTGEPENDWTFSVPGDSSGSVSWRVTNTSTGSQVATGSGTTWNRSFNANLTGQHTVTATLSHNNNCGSVQISTNITFPENPPTGSWSWVDTCSYAQNPGVYEVSLDASIQNAANWGWDTNGDGTIDISGSGNPDRTVDLGAAGNYNVRLIVNGLPGANPSSITIPSDGSVSPTYPVNVGSLAVPTSGSGGISISVTGGTGLIDGFKGDPADDWTFTAPSGYSASDVSWRVVNRTSGATIATGSGSSFNPDFSSAASGTYDVIVEFDNNNACGSVSVDTPIEFLNSGPSCTGEC